LVDALKRVHWAERFRREAGESGIRAGSALQAYARRVRPDWPTVRERVEDLEHHLALKRLLDAASHVFTGR
jgi:hypothetical protein